MASQAERPSTSSSLLTYSSSIETCPNKCSLDTAEAAVPLLWAVCGALTYTAWNRMDQKNAGGNVEKLLIV